jgi:hypothetical protein
MADDRDGTYGVAINTALARRGSEYPDGTHLIDCEDRMEDIVLNHRAITASDMRLRSLIAQLNASELIEAIGLLEDLIADRRLRPARANDVAEPQLRLVVITD